MSCFTVEKQSGAVDQLENVCYKKIMAKQYISEAGVSPALCLSNRVAYEGTCKFATTEA